MQDKRVGTIDEQALEAYLEEDEENGKPIEISDVIITN